MRREEAENERLRSLVDGGLVTSDHSDAPDSAAALEPMNEVTRSVSGLPVSGPYWARTSDLRLVEPALSQLS